MLTYFTYIPIIFLLIFLSIVIYRNNKQNKSNKYFSLFILSIVLWVFALLLSDTTKNYEVALFWSKMAIIGPAFIIYFFLLFSKVFPRGEGDFNKKYKFLLIAPAIIIIILSPTRYNIEDIIIRDWGAEAAAGQLYLFLFLYYLSYLILSFYILIKKYRRAINLLRVQIRYLFLGMGISSILGLTTNLVFLFFNINQFTFFGPISMLFFIGFTSYAILKYRLMDIKVIIKRSTVFAFLVIIITSVFTLFSYIISQMLLDITGAKSLVLNGVIMAVLVSLGFEPLKKALSQTTDSFLFKAEYDPQEVLSEYSEKFSSTLYLEELNQFISERTFEIFKPSFISLFLKNKDTGVYEEEFIVGEIEQEKMKSIESKFFKRIYNYLAKIKKEKDIVVREEFKKINERLQNKTLGQLLKILEKEEVNLMIPMYVKEELAGILFLGDKKSGDVYSQADLNILEIMASQAAVSIKNAQLYEEQRMFAQHLEKEVEKATEDLKIANEKLVKLDKAKSEFISIASHQLRTPLTVVKGYISMVLEGNFGEVNYAATDSLEKVYESNERLIQLVENLLNISRIESGRLQFNYEIIHLEDLVDSVVEELGNMAKKKGLKFTYKKPAKKLPKVKLDQEKIRQVVLNLIDNSIKYTKKGSVTVALKKTGEAIEFCVSDSGMGISKTDLPNLFKKFIRGTGTSLVHTEGTGLGLYVADQMIKSHKGKIWAESKGEGLGAKFCFVLPKYKHNSKKEVKKK